VRSLNEYNEMKQAMLRSEGALLYSDLLALHRSLQVFLGNCDQLLGFMSSHLDDPLTEMRLWAVQNREGFNRFLDEVERLYHNVAAAALSLRDHSYRVRNHWLQPVPSDTLREEHDERVRQVFAESIIGCGSRRLPSSARRRRRPGSDPVPSLTITSSG
jgi:hypothetical protein